MKKIAIVAPMSANGVTGGAEALYKGICNAFIKRGYDASLVEIVFDESSFDSIMGGYEEFRNLDLTKYDAVISTKAPSYNIKHHNHICYLVHTIRVFYDMYTQELDDVAENRKKRKEIIDLDTSIFNQINTIFTIGYEISNRLMFYNSIYHSKVIHPPLLDDAFYTSSYENFAYIPSRLHRWKKLDFLINSWRYVKSDLKLYIAGSGEDEGYFQSLSKDDSRIQLLGNINDVESKHYYSRCLFVPFVPKSEDYGYVTIEAFKSKKMVVTCEDSGEPTNIVVNGKTGYILPRKESEFANRLDEIIMDKEKIIQCGEQGYKTVESINWDNLVYQFTKRFGFEK